MSTQRLTRSDATLHPKLALLPALSLISEGPEDWERDTESRASPLLPVKTDIIKCPVESSSEKRVRREVEHFVTFLHRIMQVESAGKYFLAEAEKAKVIQVKMTRESCGRERSGTVQGRYEIDIDNKFPTLRSKTPSPLRLKSTKQLLSFRLTQTRPLASPLPHVQESVQPKTEIDSKDCLESSGNESGGKDESSNSQISSERSPGISRYGTSSAKGKGLKGKQRFVVSAGRITEENKAKIEEIFLRICGAEESADLRMLKATPEALAAFLALRYPAHMAEAISAMFKFDTAKSFTGYCAEYERCLGAREERVMKLAFDCFDFNRDHYICASDTFSAISSRRADCYDHDLCKLKSQFALKRARVAMAKSRISGFQNLKRKVVPLSSRPEALSFGDFLRIEFPGGKPQLIWDIYRHLGGFCINSFNPASFGFAVDRRKLSEDLITEAYIDPTVNLQLLLDPRKQYYEELRSEMELAPSEVCGNVLAGFDVMRCLEVTRTVVTEQSMTSNFVTVLSGPSTPELTKPRYLRAVRHFLTGNDSIHSRFIFSLYSTRFDGAVYQDDVSWMLDSFPHCSAAYRECMRLADCFVEMGLGLNAEGAESMDFDRFCDLIPSSVLVPDLIEAFSSPLSAPRAAAAFTINSV